MESIVVKVNQLALAVSATLILGTWGTAQASTNDDVANLQNEVAQLKQLVQQLSNQQQQQSVQLQQQATSAPVATPTTASNKPGWITMPDGQTQLKIYGNVRADATYDFDANPNATISNNSNAVPLNKNKGTKNELSVAATGSRFGIDVIRPTEYGDLTAKIEADFMGSNTSSGSLRLRHAYVSLNNWLVGQTASPFTNVETLPETVDFNGPLGAATARTVQVRYTQPITANQKVLFALEGGDADNINSGTTTALVGDKVTSGGNRIPSVTARYDIKTADGKGLLQVHGLAHENRISLNENNDQEKFGWGLGVGAKYNITDNDTLLANYYHVKGDSKYFLYPNFAYVAHGDTNGNLSLYESEFDTVLLGYAHKWSPKVRSTLAAGGMLYKNNNDFAKHVATNTTQNKSLYNIILNSFYSPVKNVDLGAEYTYGQRKTFADDKGDFSRFNLMAKYSF